MSPLAILPSVDRREVGGRCCGWPMGSSEALRRKIEGRAGGRETNHGGTEAGGRAGGGETNHGDTEDTEAGGRAGGGETNHGGTEDTEAGGRGEQVGRATKKRGAGEMPGRESWR